jgi:hypothetical protein
MPTLTADQFKELKWVIGEMISAENTTKANPSEPDLFAHGQVEQCNCCRNLVKCLHLECESVCAKCFPWWIAAQKPSVVHHQAAPSTSSFYKQQLMRRFMSQEGDRESE